MEERELEEGDRIMDVGEDTQAAIYIVRSGKIQQKTSKHGKRHVLETGGYFGDQMFTLDVEQGKNGPRDPTTMKAPYSVKALEKSKVAVLTLQACRTVFDTTLMGKGKKERIDSLTESALTLDSFKKHTILGAGTFGQVWLVSRDTQQGKMAYALKVQSKYELVKNGQAKAVVHEKEIMAQLHHPLITNLVAAFKDDDYIYMVMGLVQGGELYSVMHTRKSDTLPEKDAKFYIAGIAEGLGYMHR